ncbi:ComEA family DNA-binding protein [Actinomyces vulturis]|uniref:ComEA family DNA-binding protein n=1 Tax=Actinomyces vulturis TaxID=1857645 RepID=UPI00082D8878|nr:ComEA family DNA-binding protein [Actinomyces vulturis]
MAGRHRTGDIRRYIRLACTSQNPEGLPSHVRVGIHPRLAVGVGVGLIVFALLISAWILVTNPEFFGHGFPDSSGISSADAARTPRSSTASSPGAPSENTDKQGYAQHGTASPDDVGHNRGTDIPAKVFIQRRTKGKTGTTITVDIAGAVVAPGVVSLPRDSRLNDAISLAGGLTNDAMVDFINRARPLNDGEHIRIPYLSDPPELQHSDGSTYGDGFSLPTSGEYGNTPLGDNGDSAGYPANTRGTQYGVGQATGGLEAGMPGNGQGTHSDSTNQSSLVNINTADQQELMTLPGIGPAIAQAIITYRTDHGAFTQVDDLLGVPGIGPAKLTRLRPQATV